MKSFDTSAMGRAAVSNGSVFLPGADGRSAWARRARDIFAQLVADLGGADAVSEAERMLSRRAAILAVELERRETAFAVAGAAADVELAAYQTCVNSLRRVLDSLGLRRRPRDLTRADFIERARGRS